MWFILKRNTGYGAGKVLVACAVGAWVWATGLTGAESRLSMSPGITEAEACCHAGRPPRREGTGRNRVVRPEGVGRNRPVRPGGIRPGANRPPAGARNQIDRINQQRRGRDAVAGRTGADGQVEGAGTDAGRDADAARRTANVIGGLPANDRERIDGVLGEAVMNEMFDRMANNPTGKTPEELAREAYDEVLANPREHLDRVLINPERQATEEENQAVRDAFDRTFGSTTAETDFAEQDSAAADTDHGGEGGGDTDHGGEGGGDTQTAAVPPPKTPPADGKDKEDDKRTREVLRDMGRDLKDVLPGLTGGSSSGGSSEERAEVTFTDFKDREAARRRASETVGKWIADSDGTAKYEDNSDRDLPSIDIRMERKDDARVYHSRSTIDRDEKHTVIEWPDGMRVEESLSRLRIDRSTRYADGKTDKYEARMTPTGESGLPPLSGPRSKLEFGAVELAPNVGPA